MGASPGSREPDPSFSSGPTGFDPERMRELAERCERAAGPDCNLSQEIWDAVRFDNEDAPNYTASLDAAMTLMPHGLAMGFKMAPCQRAHAMLATLGEEWSGSGSVPALALCAAALRAICTVSALAIARGRG